MEVRATRVEINTQRRVTTQRVGGGGLEAEMRHVPKAQRQDRDRRGRGTEEGQVQ